MFRGTDKNITKKTAILFLLLFLVFLVINSKIPWKLVYPIHYQEQIILNAKEYNVDPYLILSIIQVETRFEPDKVSKKGAVGLMQLMPNTAVWIIEEGKFPEKFLQQTFEPSVNIELGTWYLSKLLNKYNYNLVMVIAAYNAGPGNVDKWIQDGIWDGSFEQVQNLPIGETRHYVQRVIHYFEQYQWIYEDEFLK